MCPSFPLPAVPETPLWDVVVVGAGVAGSALAYRLGCVRQSWKNTGAPPPQLAPLTLPPQSGRRVLLLERDLSEPDRIVGELLQPGGYQQLRRLGLADCVEGIDAQRVHGYVMFRNGEAASLEYPSTGDATLTGVSFHNGRFVQRLRARAASAPGVTLRCGTAVGLLGRGGGAWGGAPGEPVGGVAYKPAAASAPSGAGAAPHPPAPLRALGRLTVVCDGMYSSLRAPLRGGPALADIAAPSFFVGLVLRGAPSELLPTPGRAAVVLARAAPVLFYPISSTEVRCLVDVPGGALPAAGTGALRAHLAGLSSQLPDGPLRAAYDAAVATGGARSVQNRTLASAPLAVPGALLLGDSANMRHPLTGGGMTVALCDCSLLCELLSGVDLAAEAASSALLAPSRAPAWHAAYFARRKPWAATINTLAGALYAVFSAAGGAAWGEEMRAACFDYLRLGGACARGPVSLLSGLNPRPGVLVLHFFSVALFGVGRLLLPVPTPRACLLGARLLLGAAAIILPIIRAEGLAAVFLPPPPAPDSGAAGAKQA